MIYDAHAHVHMHTKPLKIIEKFFNANGKLILEILADFNKINKFTTVVNTSESIIPVVGIHPEHIKQQEDVKNMLERFEATVDKLNNDNIKIKAVGEVGLDMYQNQDKKILDNQIEVLREQMRYAKRNNLPVVLHIRGNNIAEQDELVDIAKTLARKIDLERVYFHSFVGSVDSAKDLINNGYYIGINGIVSYSSAKHLKDVLVNVPLKSIFIETDTPFLIPSNMPRDLLVDKKENEPLSVIFTSRLISKFKGVDFTQLWEETYESLKAFIF